MTDLLTDGLQLALDAARKSLGQADAQNGELRAEVAKWRRIRTPTHGTCCTCQACGLYHDECRCDLDDLANELELAKAEVARLASENESLRNFGEEIGAVLLEEVDETSQNSMEVSEAAVVLLRAFLDDPEDSFVVQELLAFVESEDEASHPERYDLILQKAGAQTYSENLEACKADNERLRGEVARLESERDETREAVRWCCEQSWEGTDIDGADLQDHLLSLGILLEVPASAEIAAEYDTDVMYQLKWHDEEEG